MTFQWGCDVSVDRSVWQDDWPRESPGRRVARFGRETPRHRDLRPPRTGTVPLYRKDRTTRSAVARRGAATKARSRNRPAQSVR
jgi:hypothetical protein